MEADLGDGTLKKRATGIPLKPTLFEPSSVPAAAIPTSPIQAPLTISHLNPSDLLIIKSSFECEYPAHITCCDVICTLSRQELDQYIGLFLCKAYSSRYKKRPMYWSRQEGPVANLTPLHSTTENATTLFVTLR